VYPRGSKNSITSKEGGKNRILKLAATVVFVLNRGNSLPETGLALPRQHGCLLRETDG